MTVCFENVFTWLDVLPTGPQYLESLRHVDSSCLDRLLDSELCAPPHDQQQTDEPRDAADDDLLADDPSIDHEEHVRYLRSLDPRHWLKQDHYRVLGLAALRHRATDHHIRRAYRRMVLRHHPDKRPDGQRCVDEDDDYFTCITRAYETLSDRTRRVSFDSVDPTVDDSLPDKPTDSQCFFDVFGAAFERNSRWSTTAAHLVPQLGSADSSRDHVENFYGFWFEFQSWREFGYGEDEESRERGDNRDERRFMEKQIRAQKREKKRAETARIRQLVETAYSCDPRVLQFKQEDRGRKQAAKQRRADERRRKQQEQEEQAQQAETELRQRLELEQQQRQRAADEARQRRDAERRQLTAGRQRLRHLCGQADYFCQGDDAVRTDHMMQLERLCTMLDTLQLQHLCDGIDQSCSAATEADSPRQVFLRHVQDIRQRIEQESNETSGVVSRSACSEAVSPAVGQPWSRDELQMLIKAVRMFPAGTARRWQVVAQFISQHAVGSRARSSKEVLQRAKQLQQSDHELKTSASQHALQSHAPSHVSASSCEPNGGISRRVDTADTKQSGATTTAAWTVEEQKLLEQALKTYSSSTADRWDRVAECVPSRSRKECMLRYKHLVEMVKAKKAAQAAVIVR